MREQAWRKKFEKPRPVLCLPGTAASRYVWPDRSEDTARTALYERVLRENRGGCWAEVKRPNPDVFYRRMAHTARRIRSELSLVPCMPLAKVPELYVGRQRQVYSQAVKSLEERSLTAEDAKVSAFVKVEKLPWKEGPDGPRFVPRLIQPRSPRYICSLMRYVHPIERQVYTALSRIFRERVVFKGMNADEAGQLLRQKWLRFSRPVAVGLDASRFDQHVSDTALRWEHSIYLAAVMGDRGELDRLLRMQLVNHCKLRAGSWAINYTVKGMRCSGDPNTGLGNCLLMCSMVHAYMRSLGYEPTTYSLVNNGDDCVVIMEESMLAKFIGSGDRSLVRYFDDLGFVMKVEQPVTVMEQIEFCQMHPVEIDTGRWRFVRNYTCLSKDASTVKYLPNEQAVRNYFYTVAQGGISIASGVPIYQAYYSWIARNMAGGRLIDDPTLRGGLWWWSKGMQARERPISPVARLSFARAFGISVEQQIMREQHFAQTAPVIDLTKITDAEEYTTIADNWSEVHRPVGPTLKTY